GRPAAHGLHALLAQSKHAPGLRLRRDLQLHLSAECRHLHGAAERGNDEADGHFTGQVAAIALEDRVLAYSNLDVQVARRSAVAAGLAFPGQTNAIARVDAFGHLDRQRLLLAHAALAEA